MYINNYYTSFSANTASKERNNDRTVQQDYSQPCSSVASKQPSSNITSYANDLSAVLRVLEEEFDSPTDENKVRSNSLSVGENNKNIAKYTLCESEKNFVDVGPGADSYNRETVNELSDKTELLSMVERTDIPKIIDKNEAEQTENFKEIRDIAELEQIPETTSSHDEDFQCMNCKEVFKCKIAYNDHLLTHRSHKCPQCGKEYSYKFYLKYHLITHKQRNIMTSINCTFCDKKFSNQDEHDVHIKGHVGEKPYVCTICDRSFKSRNNFKAHQQRVHTQGRKYECSYCNHTFQRSDHLHRHLRKHTGEKPHICIFCGKAFGRKDNLTCHLRVHMK